jgi:hypothetical protein
MKKFPESVAEKIGNYVYRLIDPRNGETFYVGRGVGNRLFSHIHEELGQDADVEDDKLRRIREIRLSGFEVAHVVHRHGLDIDTAKEIEAALIEAYHGLTNVLSGDYSGGRGVMHAAQIVEAYNAPIAVFEHKALLISVNVSASDSPLYEAVRYAWRLSEQRAKQTEVVLAVEKGLIRGAFIPEVWMNATAANFPGRPDCSGRLGFFGHEAPAEISERYVGHQVPSAYRFGSGNPVRYTW